MRKFLLIIATVISLPALADNMQGFYAGAAMGFVDGNTEDAAENGVDFRSIELTGGYKYNSWLGGEIRVGTGASSEAYTVGQGDTAYDINVDIDHYESIYYRAESANAIAKLYGLLGYSNVQTTNSLGDASASASESGASFGAGVGFVMNEDTNLNFEYRQLINSSDNDFSILSIGFDYRF